MFIPPVARLVETKSQAHQLGEVKDRHLGAGFILAHLQVHLAQGAACDDSLSSCLAGPICQAIDQFGGYTGFRQCKPTPAALGGVTTRDVLLLPIRLTIGSSE